MNRLYLSPIITATLVALLAVSAMTQPALAQSSLNFTVLKNIDPNVYKGSPAGSLPHAFTPVGAKTFFVARDGVHHFQLWVTDGTANGTRMLTNDQGSDRRHPVNAPNNLTALGSELIFNASPTSDARDQVWKSDGSLLGTSALLPTDPSLSSATWFTPLGDRLVFVARDDAHGWQPWITDGTAIGTHLIKLVDPDGIAMPSWFVTVGNKVYFSAATSGSGVPQVWKTDGTAGGTSRLTNTPGMNPSSLAAANFGAGPVLVFHASTPTHDAIWQSDGTPAGTSVIKSGVFGSGLTAAGDRVYFEGFERAHGPEPWVTDGTSGGTVMIKDIRAGKTGSYPSGFISAGQAVLFTANAARGATSYDRLYLAQPNSSGTVTATRVGGTSINGAWGPTTIGDRVLVEVGAESGSSRYDLVTGVPSSPAVTRIQTINGTSYSAGLVETGSNIAVNSAGDYVITTGRVKGFGQEPVIARIG